MTEDLKEQIRKAQAEMATWSEDKRKSVRLEGTDFWLSAAPTQGADTFLLDLESAAGELAELCGVPESGDLIADVRAALLLLRNKNA